MFWNNWGIFFVKKIEIIRNRAQHDHITNTSNKTNTYKKLMFNALEK
jgi:hypothetical protein